MGAASPLEAILLVGGKGTRLRPLTISTPKPLLPTAGVPFLAHQLARLRAAGVDRVILATSYHAATFRDYFGDGSPYGLELVYVTEEAPCGTGGGIRRAAQRLRSGAGEPVLVLNGDVLSGHDMSAQVARHRRAGAAVTLHLTEVADSRNFGCVPTDASGRVVAFHEKSAEPVTNHINAGCYVFDPDVISTIPAGATVSVEKETFPALLEAGALVASYVDSSYWLDVGTPDAYVCGSCDLVRGRLRSAALPDVPGDALFLEGAGVAADAAVTGGATVGARATVGPAADVSGSILFDDVTVGEGAAVRDSILASGVSVGAGAVLDRALVGDGAVVGSGNELRCGARVWPGVQLPSNAIRFSSDA